VLQVAPNIFMNAGPGCVRGACPEGEMTCGRATEVRREFEEIYREYGGLK